MMARLFECEGVTEMELCVRTVRLLGVLVLLGAAFLVSACDNGVGTTETAGDAEAVDVADRDAGGSADDDDDDDVGQDDAGAETDAGIPDADAGGADAGPCTWTPHPSNPIIEAHWTTPGDLLINDPCVLRESNHYRMWYSLGPGLGINHVKIYDGTSPDGIQWTLNPTVLISPNSDVTVSGISTPVVSGVYGLNGEMDTDFVNGNPAYTREGGGWFLWFDSGQGNYRLSDALGGDGSASWLGTGGTIVDGTFSPHTGAATGTLSITSAWDSKITETPNVILVDEIYHLYYSGAKVGDGPGRYQTGHATSPDGVTWTKDPANPVLMYLEDPLQWGFYTVGEPGVVYNNRTALFQLYYTTVRYRGPDYEGTDFAAQGGIALATSTNGSNFILQGAVLTQSASYPVEDLVMGYSTPFSMIDSTGLFHLFYDVAFYPTPGAWKQLALAHAVSTDGYAFTEIEADIFTAGSGWLEEEVRAPAVVEENGIFKMWFAGNNSLFFQPGFVWGLGYAVSNRVCR
ncbi:MAG: hypothetical protein HY897_00735 [Deltaproteobacteria bacterium]|nr:hypothetical protein [Deltaproteobacteria bacterium]